MQEETLESVAKATVLASAQGPRQGTPPTFESERKRSAERRRVLRVVRPGIDDGTAWGLSLSGGGIRSATFSLGVLQGLLKSRVRPGAVSEPTADMGPGSPLLRQFDYLSTVSGGGYIGGFFGSLFTRGRLRPNQNVPDAQADLDAAEAAYTVLGAEPPGRLRRDMSFDPARPGDTMLAWLRENGRYMAPTGSGDLFYAFAMAVRNWVAMQFVLGTMILFAFAALAFSRTVLVSSGASFAGVSFANIERSMLPGDSGLIWWSPLGWGVIAVALAWVGPAGLAFWQTHPGPGETLAARPRRLSAPVCMIGGMGAFLLALPLIVRYVVNQGADQGPWAHIAYVLWVFGAMSVASVIWYLLTCGGSGNTIATQRVVLTRRLASGLLLLTTIGLVAFVDTVAQTIYLQWSQKAAWATPASIAAVLVYGVRRIALASSEKQRTGLMKMIPLAAIATGAALALLVMLMILWDLVVLWISWGGEPAAQGALIAVNDYRFKILLITLLAAAVLMREAGKYPGFLNLASLQGLYAARLTRAYLGGSNRERFDNSDRESRSVAEPHRKDPITVEDYYANPLMPIHLVNVCVNQNNDPAEQLVQRDRKGKPLALVPGGFSLDGKLYAMPDPRASGNEMDVELGIGEWIGVSGAAVSTGMGRASGFGFSLLLTLANVRLGRWWRSGVFQGEASGTGEQKGAAGEKDAERKGAEKKRKRGRGSLTTQRYLLSELRGSFYGTNRERQYLSDGGHFENTAIYELLNAERKISLVVCADSGCDPNYAFADLANLIRLARIDFGIEIEVDDGVASHPALGRVFGTVEDFAPGGPVSQKCALLLNVFRGSASSDAGVPDLKIVLLKPRRLSTTVADVVQYQKANPEFPQEPTSDQFFDEAQWESYRRLGFEVAHRVFGVEDPAYQRDLWTKLLR